MSKIDPDLFSTSSYANEQTPCAKCGGQLLLRQSKRGLFLRCAHYPSCDYIQPLTDTRCDIEKVLDGSVCTQCGQLLALKKGRYGLFVGCTNYPACHHVESLQEHKETQISCPACHCGHLVSRLSRYGKAFFSCDNYPRCKYVLNEKPLPERCPQCGWGVMVEKRFRGRVMKLCPQKRCGYHDELI